MPANADDLLKTYEALKAQRRPWEATWGAIAATMVPAMIDVPTNQAGQSMTGQVLDSTGLQAAKLLADHIAAAVTNFQMRWFDLRMSYDPLNDLKPVGVWLDAAAKAMQDKLAATTTPRAFAEKYRQWTGFGTGALFHDRSPLPDMNGDYSAISRSLPIGTYCVAENAVGLVDTMYREMSLSPRQAVQYFGINGVHQAVKDASEKADTRHSPDPYLHAVYPRTDRDPRKEDQGNMAYASCYVDIAHKHICDEGGYRWFPYMVSRWEKLRTWSPWGFGPGHIALPEVLSLNRMDHDVLLALQMYILPPYWTDDPDAVGRVQLMPGMVNPIAQGRQIQPMRGPGQFDIGKLGMEERRQRIRQAFYMDQLITLPAPDQAGKMTAYEVSQRIAYMQRLMGPAFMGLLSEFLNPFIDVTFGTMLENDELPQPPDEVIIAAMQGYGKITVDYQGPLARAQKGDELEAIEGTLNAAHQYYQVTQDISVYDNFDIDEAISRIGKVRGIPASVMRDKQEIARMRQERAEAQAQAQQDQTMIEGAKALTGPAALMKALPPASEGTAA